jgi:sporulation protein YlmC with PRC-barrel domain
MLRMFLRSGTLLAVLCATVALSFAQQAQQQQPVTGNHPVLRAKQILGASVNLQGGTGVGTVDDIVLNAEGVIEYLIVSEGGKMVTVPWDAAKFNYEKRTAVINIGPEQFRQIPTFTVDRYPDFYAPTYRVQVYRWYGLPGRERRIERRIERREDRRP